MKQEEYYGNKFPLLKQGETYLKTLIETYPNSCAEDGLQAILYIKTRIKTPKSMIEKLRRHGMKEDSQTALQNTHDALGIRVICSFVEDVYQIARWLQERDEIQIMEKKDYIAYPKPNGYRSLHLIIQLTTDDLEGITAEIQLRTIAIDFWAALEHQIKYKHNVPHEEIIRSELKRCADEIASVDLSMQTIRDILQSDIWEQT
ncbi:MAG: RelA/SpoT domain protein [Oliverpabstia sp.]|nr:RelA/SpoT domain protein [Oliverpabstia sp.]